MARRCLVISAFLPRADDAGHRKRTFESCQLLSDLGFNLTFLHLAFEGDWYWRRQKVDHAELARCGVTEYHELHVEKLVGLLPQDPSGLHRLDEWCSDRLLLDIGNHLKHRYYDVVAVHNVWLSKVFDILDASTVRVIETHDLFSERVEQFKKVDAQPDFFTCSKQDEIFGLNRANIVIAIKEADAEWMRNSGVNAQVVTVAPRPATQSVQKKFDYLHTDKVTFGFVGSAHLFNIHSLTSFLPVLKSKLLHNPVALELKIAGKVCEKISTDEFPFLKKLGFIPSLTDFYSAVDFIFTPLDFGTGLKLKVAEAIDFDVPVIATAHSAAGVSLDESLIAKNIVELADRLIEIAAKRPSYTQFLEKIVISKKASSGSYEKSKVALDSALFKASKSFLVDYPELRLDSAHPLFSAVLSLLRLLSGQGRVWVMAFEAEHEVLQGVISKMPASVELLAIKGSSRPTEHYAFDLFNDTQQAAIRSAIFLTSQQNSRLPEACAEFYDNFAELREADLRMPTAERLTDLRNTERFSLPLFNESCSWEPSITRPCAPDFSRTTLLATLPAPLEQVLTTYLDRFYPAYEALVFTSDQSLMTLCVRWIRENRIGGCVFVQAMASKLVMTFCHYLINFGYRIHVFKGFPAICNASSEYSDSNVVVEQGLQVAALRRLSNVGI